MVMSAVAFDTHAFVKKLTATGITEPQAEAITSVVQEARGTDMSLLATRTDLVELKYDMPKWAIGISLAQVGLIVAILRMLGSH